MPEFSNQFQARLIWMNDEPAFQGRSYLLKIGTQLVPATITDIKFRTNVNTLEQAAATKLDLNEVGTVTIATDRAIAFDPYAANPLTGGFILIDRLSNATLGAGTVEFGLRRAQNLSYQSFDVNRQCAPRPRGRCRASSGSRAVGVGQIVHRQSPREAPDRRGAPCLYPRRR